MTKSEIQSILGAKTVSFNALFAKATGSVTAAVFLSQAVFWQEKAKLKNALETMDFDGEAYFSKTAAEWYDETGLSTEQQKTARKPLVASGILKEKRAGLPAKMYFRIDIDALVSGISAYLNMGITVSGFSANRKPENPRTLNGKFRKQETGKPASNNKGRELKESLESEEESGFSSTPSKVFPLEAEKKEKGLQTPAPRLEPPFTRVGEIHQADAIVKLYSPTEPGLTLVEPVTFPYPNTEHEPTEFRRVNIPDEIEALKTDEAAKETFTIGRKIPAKFYNEFVEAFRVDIAGRTETYNNRPEFRSHFFNWCGRRYEHTQRAATTPKRSHLNGAGSDVSKYLEPQKF